ncbi:hypothetical protein AYJ54_17750 [Bradyrhizobium centrolobii]|uniref:Uncharacterized protein n=2 Tax=Bradyrhizobium TaxID=374 RepID=A0A176ZIW2_9BRAD|nr:hypothetical protein AYJ54_17750 [Bradyrhizobium centrolobii]OAF19725.1 hypothetical protein AXW67_35825 [Bradyrhizobium neotropicale]
MHASRIRASRRAFFLKKGHCRIAAADICRKAGISRAFDSTGDGLLPMMRAARDVWEAAGYRVIGAVPAGTATEALSSAARILSCTLSSWELRWQNGRDALYGRTVMVIDEAGMIASRQMATFVETASRSENSSWSVIPTSFSQLKRVPPHGRWPSASAMPSS